MTGISAIKIKIKITLSVPPSPFADLKHNIIWSSIDRKRKKVLAYYRFLSVKHNSFSISSLSLSASLLWYFKLPVFHCLFVHCFFEPLSFFVKDPSSITFYHWAFSLSCFWLLSLKIFLVSHTTQAKQVSSLHKSPNRTTNSFESVFEMKWSSFHSSIPNTIFLSLKALFLSWQPPPPIFCFLTEFKILYFKFNIISRGQISIYWIAK